MEEGRSSNRGEMAFYKGLGGHPHLPPPHSLDTRPRQLDLLGGRPGGAQWCAQVVEGGVKEWGWVPGGQMGDRKEGGRRAGQGWDGHCESVCE
jgi:hypothetical protein